MPRQARAWMRWFNPQSLLANRSCSSPTIFLDRPTRSAHFTQSATDSLMNAETAMAVAHNTRSRRRCPCPQHWLSCQPVMM